MAGLQTAVGFGLALHCGATSFHGERTFELEEILYGETENNLNLLQRRALERGRTTGRSIWLTDFHIDPFYLTSERQCVKKNVSTLRNFSFGIMGCDPPMSLARSVVSAVEHLEKSHEKKSDYVIFTGDFTRHHPETLQHPFENVSGIIGEVSSAMNHLRPGQYVFGALGNDDNPANYFQNITSNKSSNRWFEAVGHQIETAHCMSKETRKQFNYGSFFEMQIGNLTILSIATVIYSVKHAPANTSGQDPFYQFAWLRQKLFEAVLENRKVWIVGHVPPGMETFGYSENWQPRFVQDYLDIVQDEVLGSVIAAQLFGHVHKDEIRLLPHPVRGAGPIFLSSALSPVYYNNPSFKTVTYDKHTGDFLDFDVFLTRISNVSALEWEFGYGFKRLYQLPNLSMESLATMASQLLEGESTWKSYAYWYTAGYPNDLQRFSANASDSPEEAAIRLFRRHQYVCAITIQSAESYQECVDSATVISWRSRSARDASGELGGAGPRTSVHRLVQGIPQDLEEEEQMILARLLRWAELRHVSEAAQIIGWAEQHRWRKLLKTYGPSVEKAQETGVSLDDIFTRPGTSER
ncbi:unnamed protein product [Durusdinium trenchii]|uniref:Calcineurin-like phosphoesterase domain-containing protein n=1 Tax=Durusdinium trenchii TaxID=1381693 RepID=A0ABP0SM58_9DINO